ncbi:DinB family protein [Marivirga sp. S37H4]|uniref:DinB family protein n=1 Tax=Marivirga aurantiaca TaxID=2802615 RepID=A0A934WV67_9BACT|nr:DinB family protein [Marivirga aurantiaca]MBK6263480.1 DinB family protein [Marivirga aurantiaca]
MIWLKDVIKDLKAIQLVTKEEFLSLSEEELIWKPQPDKWSVAECLKHILIANEIYLKDIENKLKKAEVRTIEHPVKFSLTGKIFLFFVDPKYKWKVPSPKIFKPVQKNKVEEGKATIMEFLDLQGRIIEAAEKAYGYDHTNIYTFSPISKFLRFNIGEQFYIMMRHTKRHLNQARRVKNLQEKQSV